MILTLIYYIGFKLYEHCNKLENDDIDNIKNKVRKTNTGEKLAFP